MSNIQKIELEYPDLNLIYLKDGRIVGIDNASIVLYDNFEDVFSGGNKNYPHIDLTKKPLFPVFPTYDDNFVIPEGWIDISYGNDACPSICKSIDKDTAIVIYCDFKELARRRDSTGSGSQFMVATEIDGSMSDFEEFIKFENAILFGNSLFNKAKGE